MIFAPIFSWLVSKLGSVWAKVIEVAFVVLIIVAPFWLAYHSGKTNCENTVALQAAQGRMATVEMLSKITANGDAVAGDYVLRRGAAEVVYQTITKEVHDVTTVYKPSLSAPAEALPMCVFTRGFVGVWNAALEAGHDAAGLSTAAARVTPAAAPAGPVDDADLLDAGTTQRDVLDNHTANAAACTAAEQWHDAVMAWDKATFGAAPK